MLTACRVQTEMSRSWSQLDHVAAARGAKSASHASYAAPPAVGAPGAVCSSCAVLHRAKPQCCTARHFCPAFHSCRSRCAATARSQRAACTSSGSGALALQPAATSSALTATLLHRSRARCTSWETSYGFCARAPDKAKKALHLAPQQRLRGPRSYAGECELASDMRELLSLARQPDVVSLAVGGGVRISRAPRCSRGSTFSSTRARPAACVASHLRLLSGTASGSAARAWALRGKKSYDRSR